MISLEKREYNKQYYQKNRDEALENSKKYYWQHREERIKAVRIYRENNIEKCKQYRINNSEKKLEYSRLWRENNIEKKKAYQTQYNQTHKKEQAEWQRNNPEKTKAYKDNWCKNNPDKVKEKAKRYYYQHKTDLRVNLNGKVRRSIWESLMGNKNGWHWETLVGYTLTKLKEHLEKTMPNGYTWNDYIKGRLHIDHIIPIRTFTFQTSEDEDFKNCWDLCNLRLLTKEENFKKNSNFDNPILLGLLLKETI